MNSEVIITCAITGAGDTVGKHPAIPVTPEQIARSALEAAGEGAAIVHIHVREPETGKPSHDTALFREVVERIRDANAEVLINLTGGGGGDFMPNDDDPATGGPGTDMQTPEERHAHIGALLPELCSLDCGSLNFGDAVYISAATWLRRQASLIQASGVKPELECFDFGHVWLAKQLIKEGLVDDPPFFQLCLGIPWGAEANTETMTAMRNMLPANAEFAAFGIGRMQMPMAAQSVLLGGHVRVGLEDNLFLERGVHASNGQLVERAVSIVHHLGARVLTPQQARERLQLKARS